MTDNFEEDANIRIENPPLQKDIFLLRIIIFQVAATA